MQDLRNMVGEFVMDMQREQADSDAADDAAYRNLGTSQSMLIDMVMHSLDVDRETALDCISTAKERILGGEDAYTVMKEELELEEEFLVLVLESE